MANHAIVMNSDGIGIAVNGKEEKDLCHLHYKSTGDAEIKIGKDYVVDADNSLSLVVGDISLKISKDKRNLVIEQQDTAITLDDKMINLSVGGSSITIKDGEITLQANKISINGTQSVAIEGTSQGISAKGMRVAIEGTTSTSIKGSASLDLESSGPATLKGTLTSIG